MPTETTYTALRENLATYLDGVVNDREVLLVRRRGAPDVAIIPADELAGLLETAHLSALAGRTPDDCESRWRSPNQTTRSQPRQSRLRQLSRNCAIP